jgi:peptidoglycan/LPS O-acetylase OafA/YrhL
MGLLSIPIFFLLVLILFAILFPRLMRFLVIALFVFVGVTWLIDAAPDKTTPPRQELRR